MAATIVAAPDILEAHGAAHLSTSTTTNGVMNEERTIVVTLGAADGAADAGGSGR